MATEQNEVVDPVEEKVEVEPVEAEENQDDGAGQQEAEPGEMVISLGDEPVEEEQQRAPEWVRELRKSDREKAKRIRELEQQLQASAPGQKQEALGTKPTLEGCDFDADKFEAELTAWHDRKRQVDDKAAQERKAAEEAQAAWDAKVSAYNTAKAELPVADFEDAEAAVLEHLDQVKQAIILNGADKPEQLMYALGKSPAKLKELAAVKDPVKFAFAVAKLEAQVKVTERKKPPAPEKTVRGSGGTGIAVDSTLERLQAEADRTGDRTKVAQYLRQKKQAA
jgi:hypothetical protein